ncbi:MAG: CvpA family protein [Planctomyces sp.]|nr:CvpA family protein [Planctomyces sp.]
MWYDVVVLIVLVYCTARGASRGLIWQLATIASIVLCLLFAESFAAVVGPHITLDPPLNEWVTLFAAYLFFSFVAFGAARILNHGVEKVKMGEFNQHLGALFGFLKGAVICLVMTFFMATLPATQETIRHSKSGRVAAIIVDRIHPAMPASLRASLKEYIHALDNLVPIESLNAHDGDDDPWGTAMEQAATAQPSQTPAGLWDLVNPPTGATPLAPIGRSSIPGSSIPGAPVPPPADPNSPSPASNNRSSIPRGVTFAPGQGLVEPAAAVQQDADFWSRVKGTLGDEARRKLSQTLEDLDPATRRKVESQVLELLNSTRSEDLPQLKQQLLRSGVDAIPAVMASWEQFTSRGAAPETEQRRKLLEEVSQLRSSFPQIQARMQSEIRGLMAGVPENIAVRVLQDWKADLLHDARNDPDPGTTAETTVEARILRQLEAAGLRMEGLDHELRDRLSAGAEGQLELR